MHTKKDRHLSLHGEQDFGAIGPGGPFVGGAATRPVSLMGGLPTRWQAGMPALLIDAKTRLVRYDLQTPSNLVATAGIIYHGQLEVSRDESGGPVVHWLVVDLLLPYGVGGVEGVKF